ncbi:MAG: IclR family transcriptional regulator [Xanthobacteraceae bacterium]|nr:IclR family transcriptional regulator [Xanthobacteraceae bacterium]
MHSPSAAAKRTDSQFTELDEGNDRKFVVALARGLDVLRAFTPGEWLLGNNEIAERTGLPKTTISRLTYTLTKLGYLTHVERLGKYSLAPAALSIGYSTLANLRIRQVARKQMQDFANYAGASVALGSRDRMHVIYIEHCRSKSDGLLRLNLGSRIPIATTAMGRALIAALPEDERDWLMGHVKRHAGSDWQQVKAGIEKAVLDLAERGFTTSFGEWERDVFAVGVPLIPPDDSGVFAFNCGANVYQTSREKLEEEVGPRLVNLAKNVEAALSGG